MSRKTLSPFRCVPLTKWKHWILGGFAECDFFPELLKYKSLKKVSFWENDLQVLPEEFFQLKSLETLYVCCNLETLAPAIGNLQQLKFLELPDNNIDSIPETLQQLKQLQVLDLSGNNLKQLPSFLADLPRLKKLSVFNSDGLMLGEATQILYRERGISLWC